MGLQFSPLILLLLHIQFGGRGVFAQNHHVLVYRSQLLQVILVCLFAVINGVNSGHFCSFFVDAVTKRGSLSVVEALEEQSFIGLK